MEAQKPVAMAMPALPSDGFMSPEQWQVFFAVMDACIPAVASAAATSDPDMLLVEDSRFQTALERCGSTIPGPTAKRDLEALLAYRPSRDPAFRAGCVRALARSPSRDRLANIMYLLSTRFGSLLLTGYWYPITQQPAAVREAIMRSWHDSRLLPLRAMAKGLCGMALMTDAVTSPHFSQLSGYSDVPGNWRAGPGFPFSFLHIDDGEDVYELSTDVVIVGSGCGGSVCAKNLAEAGHCVIVVDKGYHFPPSQLPMAQDAACEYLFENGGCQFSDDSSIGAISGGAWGGGGTVNWSVCFRPPEFVRREWAAAGLPLFDSPAFDQCLDRVWDSIGATTEAIRHNPRNQALLDGCRRLGWKASVVEQNTAGEAHYCGQCHLGCGSSGKKGPTVTWLPAAAEAGARFMEGFRVDSVLFAEDGVTATGVEGLWTSRDADGNVSSPPESRVQRRVRITASKVILSGGALWSPVILMKSGVDNRNVGRNLYLHPCNIVTAAYKEHMRPWEGGIITGYSGEFENLDSEGHGVRLESACMVPYLTVATQTWHGGLDAKLLSLRYGHLSSFIALTRDRDPGRVYVDAETGRPRISYAASGFDSGHALEGVQALAKICYVTGAREIRASLAGAPAYVVEDGGERQREHAEGTDPEFTDEAFGAWLARLRAAGNRPPTAVFASAHQMGTCRMSADEASGVVDGRGQVWGRRGLFVADASVFPSASGVNPMVTVMALADWISRGVAAELAEEAAMAAGEDGEDGQTSTTTTTTDTTTTGTTVEGEAEEKLWL
ncbi:hypothetical protein CP532_4177 [Ophiocordyceps camponoti-leonardi (nom. inval.)]|nr:hypothetical protein CP532_4177 [Ophiocordyceps camponoti-leonardi (nom. inval.)]